MQITEFFRNDQVVGTCSESFQDDVKNGDFFPDLGRTELLQLFTHFINHFVFSFLKCPAEIRPDDLFMEVLYRREPVRHDIFGE